MNRLINFHTKSAIAITIATNYWIQYHRREGQSPQLVLNNGSNGYNLIKCVQMSGNSNAKHESFTDQWFAPFVSIKHSYRMSNIEPRIAAEVGHWASGFICHRKGFVLTVFAAAPPPDALYFVRLGDGREANAHVVYKLDIFDIIVLKLEDTDETVDKWPYAELGRPQELKVDERVLSVGTTRCLLHNQCTAGTVFAHNIPGSDIIQIGSQERYKRGIKSHKYIQHTAVINGSDTGSALVNTRGQVVGITFLKCDEERPTDNIAVPIDNHEVFAFIETYKHWESDGPPLGLRVYYLDDKLRQILQKDQNLWTQMARWANTDGILIWDLSPEFQQHFPMLMRFDVITHINGTAVKSIDDMYRAVRMIRCRQYVVFRVNKQEIKMTIKEDILSKLCKTSSRLV